MPTHPRPQLTRPDWLSLDGEWDFTAGQAAAAHDHVQFDQKIQVPYPPESRASGLSRHDPQTTVWYQRDLSVVDLAPWERVILHFGAVDYHATVWVNDQRCAEHRGGHTPFSFDITAALHSGQGRLVVRADDDALAFDQPRGKQEWRDESHAIWYPRTTGIWQTVWLERVPATRIIHVECTPRLVEWAFDIELKTIGPLAPGSCVRVQFSAEGHTLCDDTFALLGSRSLKRRVYLNDPGIVDERMELLWSPEHPQLIDVQVQLLNGTTVTDDVRSYTAMRDVRTLRGEFMLNGAGYVPRLVLDQGYWPDTLMTATDEQFRRDIELTKQLGFNGARKHQKIESPRYLYWCDVLGLLVWEEMPSAYSLSDDSVRDLSREWLEAVQRDRGHPCIVTWVPLNESWGVPDLPHNPAAQHLLRALYHLTRAADPSRPVISNDGWEHGTSDILGVHDYTSDPQALLKRFGTSQATEDTLRHFKARPYSRVLLLDPDMPIDAPVMLTEFGGTTYSDGLGAGWGYAHFTSSEAFLTHYEALLAAVHACRGLQGFCYTQLADTFQERNGLLTDARRFKADPTRLAAATRGAHSSVLYVQEGQVVDNPLGYDVLWLQRLARRTDSRRTPDGSPVLSSP
ncbi:glycoside hydrolase family 2 protein [Deinococcus ruber]|uniref:Beta-galactosidase n=1 Tax=Deinococcus ruber TaxID=1848197 RepID=A0A918CQ27_9DEIO|nr:sugar-binding domain-containing protein [Deinococcus ruber]GGR32874.1 beta-galactosidase [Deinococcus ruber]